MKEAASAETVKSGARGMQALAQNLVILSPIDQDIATDVSVELTKKYVATRTTAGRSTSDISVLPLVIF